MLVEGVTEMRTVQQILRLLGKDHKLVPIPLGGSGMINGNRECELQEVQRISDKVYALIDSEKTSEADLGPRERKQFQASCDKLGIRCHVTKRRATENYFTDVAVKKVKGGNICALDAFEKLDNAIQTRWGKNDNWLIAREMSLEDWRTTDIGEFLDAI